MADPRRARAWWSRWWAVACWFVLTTLAVVPAALGWAITAFYPVDHNQAGIDMQVEAGTPSYLRILSAAGLVLAAVLPFLVARWARKQWLGYLLLGAVVALALLLVGLVMFRVL